MLFKLLTRLVGGTSAFAYPAYASYKAIKINDAQALEVLLMYWAVMAIVSVAELTVEWLLCWLPLYYEVKLLVLLWLSLPQIQGSTFVYVRFVHPFLTAHEDEIDAAMAEAKDRAKALGLEYLRRGTKAARDTVMRAITASETPEPAEPEHALAPPNQNILGQLLRHYGPAALGAVLNPEANLAASGHLTSRGFDVDGLGDDDARRERVRARRHELRRQLAALGDDGDASDHAPPPPFLGGASRGHPAGTSAVHPRSVSEAAIRRSRALDQSTIASGYEDVSRDEAPITMPVPQVPSTPNSWWYGSWGAQTSPRERSKMD